MKSCINRTDPGRKRFQARTRVALTCWLGLLLCGQVVCQTVQALEQTGAVIVRGRFVNIAQGMTQVVTVDEDDR